MSKAYAKFNSATLSIVIRVIVLYNELNLNRKGYDRKNKEFWESLIQKFNDYESMPINSKISKLDVERSQSSDYL